MDATSARAEKLHIGGVEQDDERCLRLSRCAGGTHKPRSCREAQSA